MGYRSPAPLFFPTGHCCYSRRLLDQDVAMKTPDYDALQKKANQVGHIRVTTLADPGSWNIAIGGNHVY